MFINRIFRALAVLSLFAIFSCKKEEAQPLPVADFYAQVSSCENDTCVVYFYDNSINSVNRSWDFGNGKTSTIKMDSSLYNQSNSYVIELKVVNSDGVEDVKMKNLQF